METTLQSASFSDRVSTLSPRETEVFNLIVRGQVTKSISQQLGISIKTVETHRLHINRKLGTRSPGELIRCAALSGISLTA
jgi:two-component system response regulator NreC